MTQIRFFQSAVLLLGAGGLAAIAWIGSAFAQSSSACSLSAHDQVAALEEFQAVRARYGGTITRAELTLSLQGDHDELTRVLDRIEAREAGCCAPLELTRTRTSNGFEVHVAGEGAMVDIVATILSASLPGH